MASGKGGKRKGFKPVGAQASASNSSARLKGRAAAGQSGGTARVREWRFLVTAGAIVVGALLLRLYRIGAEELWLDEASSWIAATMPRMTGSLAIRNNPPLYYLLLRASVVVAGQSEAGLRMLSAVAGTLFVAAVIWTGREIFDSRVGLWSGAVAAVAPIHIYYSQEARAYALLTLALALTYATLWRALRANTWRWWALASASAVMALYSHYLAVLALLPTAYLVMAWPGPRRWRRYTAALLGSGLLFLPWVVWSFLLTPHSFAGIAWIETVWESTPPWLAIPLSLEVFGIGPQAGLLPIHLRQFDALTFPGPFRLLGLVLLALLGLWVAVPWGDERLGVPWPGKRKAWLGLLLFFPLGALWLVSFYKPVYVVGRYDLAAYPAYALLMGLALRKLQRVKPGGPLLALCVALLLVVPIGAKLFRYYRAPSEADARKTAAVLDTVLSNGDVVVFTGLRGLPVLYYLYRLDYRWQDGYCQNELAGRRFACRMYPRETEEQPAVFDPSRVLTSPDAVDEDVREFLRMRRPPGGSLWVVFASGSFSHGDLHLPEVDTLLVENLQRLGLQPVRVPGALGIFRFQQS